jgi:hypothetical protein
MMPGRDEANTFDGVIVFSATMRRERGELGERITDWLNAHPECVPVDKFVVLTSGRRFHCHTVVIFWRSR